MGWATFSHDTAWIKETSSRGIPGHCIIIFCKEFENRHSSRLFVSFDGPPFVPFYFYQPFMKGFRLWEGVFELIRPSIRGFAFWYRHKLIAGVLLLHISTHNMQIHNTSPNLSNFFFVPKGGTILYTWRFMYFYQVMPFELLLSEFEKKNSKWKGNLSFSTHLGCYFDILGVWQRGYPS